MEESTCRDMVIDLLKFSCMKCFFALFMNSKYDFYVDAERIVAKT